MINFHEFDYSNENLSIDLELIKRKAKEFVASGQASKEFSRFSMSDLIKANTEIANATQKFGGVDGLAKKIVARYEQTNENLWTSILIGVFSFHFFIKILQSLRSSAGFAKTINNIVSIGDGSPGKALRSIVVLILFVYFCLIFVLGSIWHETFISTQNTSTEGKRLIKNLSFRKRGLHDWQIKEKSGYLMDPRTLEIFLREEKIYDLKYRSQVFKELSVGSDSFDIYLEGEMIGHFSDGRFYKLTGEVVSKEVSQNEKEALTDHHEVELLSLEEQLLGKKKAKKWHAPGLPPVDELRKKIRDFNYTKDDPKTTKKKYKKENVHLKSFELFEPICENVQLARKILKDDGTDYNELFQKPDSVLKQMKELLESKNKLGYFGLFVKLFLRHDNLQKWFNRKIWWSSLSGQSGASGICVLSGQSAASGISALSGQSGASGICTLSGQSNASGICALSGQSNASGISGPSMVKYSEFKEPSASQLNYSKNIDKLMTAEYSFYKNIMIGDCRDLLERIIRLEPNLKSRTQDLFEFESFEEIWNYLQNIEKLIKLKALINQIPKKTRDLIWSSSDQDLIQELGEEKKHLEKALIEIASLDWMENMFLKNISAYKNLEDLKFRIYSVVKREPWLYDYWYNKLNNTKNVQITWSSKNDKQIICVVHTYAAIKKIAYMTNWCLLKNTSIFSDYTKHGFQFILYDFNYDYAQSKSIKGFSLNSKDNPYRVTNIHDCQNATCVLPAKFSKSGKLIKPRTQVGLVALVDLYSTDEIDPKFVQVERSKSLLDKLFLTRLRNFLKKDNLLGRFLDWY